MEWREQTSVSCEDAFSEAQRWLEEVTKKLFRSSNFRSALEDGVLLCDLINQLKPGVIKRVNRLSTPIAGLDNVNVFLRACGKLGLNEAQLFHPGDLQDLSTRANLRHEESNRRLKNVLITIYWLGRKAHVDPYYHGPQLNLKAFEGLLGIALSKALEESSCPRTGPGVKDSGDDEAWYPEREHPAGYRRGESVDSLVPLEGRLLGVCSEGCGSDAEAERGFRMEDGSRPRDPAPQRERGYVPAPLRRKRTGQEDERRGPPSPLTRPPQVNPGWIWSKSLSDIVVNQWTRSHTCQGSEGDVGTATGVGLGDNWEQPQGRVARVKDSEAVWHDDLTKWKNRRRSTASDLRRKIQQREPIGQLANGDGASPTETGLLGGVREQRDQKRTGSLSSVPSSSSSSLQTSSTAKEPSAALRPHTRALLARGYATESPLPPVSLQAQELNRPAMPASEPSFLGEKSHAASRGAERAGGATTPTVDVPFTSRTHQSQTGNQDKALVMTASGPDWSGTAFSDQTRTTTKLSYRTLPGYTNGTGSTSSNGVVQQTSLSTLDPPVAGTRLPGPVDHAPGSSGPSLDLLIHPQPWQKASLSDHHPKEEQPVLGIGPADAGLSRFSSRAGSWSGGSDGSGGVKGRMSATLPRGFRRSEGSSRLSVVMTPRPFGTKQSRVASLPRVLKMDHCKSVTFNGEKDQPPTQTSPSHHRRVNGQSCPWANQSTVNEEEKRQEDEGNSFASALRTEASNTQPQVQNQAQAHPNTQAQVYPKTRVQPQTHAYSRVQAQVYPKTQVQPQTQAYSDTQAQAQAQARGSPTLSGPATLSSGPGNHFSQVRHSDMRVSLSMKPNSRTDFGYQTQWDSRGARVRSIHPGTPAEQCQLLVGDEIVTVGGHKVAQLSYDQWEGTMSSALQAGSLTMDIRRYGNNDWASGHAPQSPSCRKIIDLTAAAPTLIGRSEQCASDQSDAAKGTTMTKPGQSNGQSTNGVASEGLNGSLRDDPVSLRSRGGSESAISDLQVPSIGPSSCSWSWDPEEERKRQERWQEEQERLLQEKYRQDQERMETEWKRAQQEAGGEFYKTPDPTNGTPCPPPAAQSHLNPPPTNGVTNHMNVTELDQDREEPVCKEAESVPEKSEQEEKGDRLCEQNNWTKSVSTTALDGLHKPGAKGAVREPQWKRRGQEAGSPADQERQRILEEMRKRTQLLTDNSWIRQRSSSIYKEPIYVGVPMRRYESLENLDSPTSSSVAIDNRPHSVAGCSAPSRMSASRYSLGAGSSEHHSPWSRPSSTSPTPGEEPHGQSHPSSQPVGRSVSSSLACCVCEQALGRGAAMVIEALALCFHLACFQCVDCGHPLGRSEVGAQVRVRDRKPYCDPCYLRLKAGPPSFP